PCPGAPTSLLSRRPRPPRPTLFPYTTLFRSDPDKMEQVMDNLISNAIKYTPQGSIEVGCVQKGDVVEVYVKDTGPGISAEHLERDRKSTRLNSSHVKISYAVFCLKKKILGAT